VGDWGGGEELEPCRMVGVVDRIRMYILMMSLMKTIQPQKTVTTINERLSESSECVFGAIKALKAVLRFRTPLLYLLRLNAPFSFSAVATAV
jgi:hypothetical protein